MTQPTSVEYKSEVPAYNAIGLDTVRLNTLPAEEQECIAETNKIGPEVIRKTDTSSASDKIDNLVTIGKESPAIEQIAINANIIKETNLRDMMDEIELRCQDELLA